jgi:hypothetical protein
MAHITELRTTHNAIRRTHNNFNSDLSCLAGFIVSNFIFFYPHINLPTNQYCNMLMCEWHKAVLTTGQLAVQLYPTTAGKHRCCTSYTVVHYVVLLTMGILMPKTCGDKGRWINFICVASSWVTALPSFTMHGHMNIKSKRCVDLCIYGVPYPTVFVTQGSMEWKNA